MPDTASLVSAIAAVIAASLAGANLYLNGRREDRRWARETLVELFASYLDASFRWSGTVAHEGGQQILEDVATERRRHADQAHHDQTAILTRLRLLAPKPVVDAAIVLHGAGHDLADLTKRVPLPAADEFLACDKVLWAARLTLIAEAKKTLGLDPSITDVVHSATG